MLSAPLGSFERVSVPTVSVRVQRLACARLSLAVGARQLWPWRRPGPERVILICSVAVADSVKRKVVPSGAFLAETAVSLFATRKRLLVSLAAVIAGGCVLVPIG